MTGLFPVKIVYVMLVMQRKPQNQEAVTEIPVTIQQFLILNS